MATLLDLAKEAFKNHNYTLSLEIYERALRTNERKSTDLYFGYGDSLAKNGRIKDALDIYSHICYQLCEIIPVERLKCLATSIIEFLIKKRTSAQINCNETSNKYFHDQVDPLCCRWVWKKEKKTFESVCRRLVCYAVRLWISVKWDQSVLQNDSSLCMCTFHKIALDFLETKRKIDLDYSQGEALHFRSRNRKSYDRYSPSLSNAVILRGTFPNVFSMEKCGHFDELSKTAF